MIETILNGLADPGQPDATFRALDAAWQDLVGHRLFTLLLLDGDEVARVYSTVPDKYPVSGRKPMGTTPWGELVLRRKRVFLGRTRADIEWAFFDHALIASMGLGSNINVPVVYDGDCLGAISLSHAEHHYTDEHVSRVTPLVPLLIPAFLRLRAGGPV
jgi:hypothetical protein